MAEVGPYATVDTGLDVEGLRDTIHVLKAVINRYDYDPIVRSAAQKIVAGIPSHDDTGQIATIFHWLLTYVAFRKDPSNKELIESPAKIIAKIIDGEPLGIDCDDFLALAGSMLQALGHDVRFAIEGTQQAGIFEHIHLEVFDDSAGQWYAFDPSLSNAPLGTPLQGLLSRWVESSKPGTVGYPPPIGVIDAELGDTHPCAIGLAPDDYQVGDIVHVGDRQWVRDGAEDTGARYWRYAGRLGMVKNHDIRIDIIEEAEIEIGHADGRPVTSVGLGQGGFEQTGQVELLPPDDLVRPGDLPGLLPGEIQPRVVDFSNQNQEIYILMTQPDINPIRLRYLFGFRRPPAEREKWRREFWRNADYQESLPLRVQVALGEDYIKVPMPGRTSGNSVAALLEHFEDFVPSEMPHGGGDPGGRPPSWKDLVPDPDEFFGRGFGQGLWCQLTASIFQDNISVQDLIDLGFILTGRDLAPGLNGTNIAASTMVSPSILLTELGMTQGPLGEPMAAGAIIALIIELIIAASAAAGTIAGVVVMVKDLANGDISTLISWATKNQQMGEDGVSAAEKARELEKIFEGWEDDPVSQGEEWKEDYKRNQEEAIDLAIARDALDRLYLDVLQWGFSSANTSLYRAAIRKMAETDPMLYLMAKERTLRDFRHLKISALAGATGEMIRAWDSMLADMQAAGGLIKEWAEEYAALPFDTEHVEIPGAPDPNPPTELPPGNFPYTNEDDPPENPFLDEEELEGLFIEERNKGAASGYTWAGSGNQWAGRTPPERDRQRVRVAPNIYIDVAPGAGGTNVVTIDPETGMIDVTRREEQGFIARHPIVTAVGVAGAAYGIFKLVKKLRGN